MENSALDHQSPYPINRSGPASDLTPDLAITWCNLSVWIKKKKPGPFWKRSGYENLRILNNVNGIVKSGTMLAILGASGAGKTTLIAALSQRMIAGEMEGDILLNGRSVPHDLMNKLSGFVPQHDLVVETLTVLEHMTFMARLKMDRRLSTISRARRISELLLDLGLNTTKQTRLAMLSGGEMKRVSLAVQLLTDPHLLFCDEPTTGLDSYNASTVIQNLRNFSERGKIVICTIHQPASGIFDMFSRVILLASGRVAFQGDVPGAEQHFRSLGLKCPVTYNQAEFYVRQLAVLPGKEDASLKAINQLCDNFDLSKYGQILTEELTLYKGRRGSILTQTNTHGENNDLDTHYFIKYTSILSVHFGTQLVWLTWRSALHMYRTRSVHFLKFGLFLMVGLLISTPYTNLQVNQAGVQDLQGLLYLIITETIFTHTYAVLHTFQEEIPIFLREMGNGLSQPGPYYISKIIILLPKAIIEAFTYTAIIFYIAGLNGGVGGFFTFSVPVIMCAITATAYGCLLSALFESISTATLLSVPLDFIALVSSGLFVQIRLLPNYLKWLPYVSQFFYGVEAVSILQWKQIDNIDCPSDTSLPCISSGSEVLVKFGYNISHFSLDIGALFVMYVVAHTMGFLAILRRSKKQPVY